MSVFKGWPFTAMHNVLPSNTLSMSDASGSTNTVESLTSGRLFDSSSNATRAYDALAGQSKYETVQELGRGTFGFVQLARTTATSDVVAIKFLNRGDHVTRYVQTEILNHRMLRHPHVIEFKEVFLTPYHVCIAMEYASGGDLTTYIKNAGHLTESVARYFFQQLIIGLDYCHRRGVVNRDIKLENTLLQLVPGLPLPLIKICDFGYSKAHFMSAPKSKVGSPAYMAPEVMRSTGDYNGHLADIWSCGVMLYVMLCGQFPFSAAATAAACNALPGGRPENRMQSLERMLQMKWSWSVPDGLQISPECHHLLGRLLVPDPSQRITMAEILVDPWFLTNMPSDLLLMNDMFLNHGDCSGMQAFEEIKAILQEARAPAATAVASAKQQQLLHLQQDMKFEVVEEGGREAPQPSGGSWFGVQGLLKRFMPPQDQPPPQ